MATVSLEPARAKQATKKRPKRVQKGVVGWREWVALPALGIPQIKAKMDTGARTSALHGVDIEAFHEGNKPWVRFKVHPRQRSREAEQSCVAPLIDRRAIRSSSGGKQYRYVIMTTLRLGEQEWPIEVTLTGRERMGFRLLIGRTAIRKRFMVDPGRSFVLGERS